MMVSLRENERKIVLVPLYVEEERKPKNNEFRMQLSKYKFLTGV
jgi:hypothetical protein